MKQIFSLVFLLSLAVSLSAQTLVNQTIAASSLGKPTKYYGYIKGVPLSNGGFALMYNNYLSGLQLDEYTVIVIDSNNNTVGSLEYSSLYPGNNFGTNLYAKGQYLYIVGFTLDSTGTNSVLCSVLKMDINTADTVWTINSSIDSAVTQAPFSVVVDDSGYVYMGASVRTPVDYKIEVVKYSPNGVKIWQSSYDTVGLYTIPVAMALSPSGNALAVTGFSFDGIGHSNFVTADFTTSTGTMYGFKTSSSGTGMISHPVNIAVDEFSNSYIAGTSTVSGAASVIKVVAYDTSFNQLWMSTWGDSTLTNIASGMTMSLLGLDGNIFVTGSTISATGKHSIVVLRYTTDGTLQWAKTISAPNPAYPADGIAIATDGNGNSFVTGTMFNGTDTTVVTAGLDSSSNILWLQNFNRGVGINDAPYGINYASSIGLLVTTRSFGADSFYMGLQYEQFTAPNTIQYDTNSKPLYVAGQIMLRFNPSIVNTNFVNNVKMQFTLLDSVIPDSVIVLMNKNTGLEFHGTTIAKIFKGLTTTDTISITRFGTRIHMPEFWADFLLYPNLSDETETDVINSFNLMPQLIFKSEVNSVGSFTSVTPNDPLFTSNKQKALCDATEGIDACTAWGNNIAYTGSSDIKIGHYDTGIKSTQQDFQFAGSSVIADGYDYYNNVNILTEPFNDADGHGTATASIYGAVSNNSVGIAGVAGGDAVSGTQGVSIYNLKVVTTHTHVFSSVLFAAYVQAATLSPIDTTGTVFGYGVFITNHSYVIPAPLNGGFMMDGIRWCFQNGITTVAASGNDNSTTLNYPASFYDDWVIKVGANDETGARWVDSPTIGSTYGNNLDLVAPGTNNSSNYVATADTTNTYDNSSFGTSLAAPFVTGSAALIMGYIAHTYPSQQFSPPEDIEHLLQFYTKDIAHGYSDSIGWGRLDIGNVFNSLSYPKYKIRQNFGAFDSTNATLLASGTSITLAYNAETSPYAQFINLPSMNGLSPVTYTVDVYHLSGTVSHSPALDPTETVINTYGQHAWILNSSSNMWGLYNASNVLTPEVDVTLSNVTNTQADVDGYTYHFTASSADTSLHDLWLPVNPFNNFGTFGYSLHTVNSVINGINEVATATNTLNAYPNPTSNELNISIYTSKPETVHLTMTNIDGQVLYTKQLENSNGAVNFTINTTSFVSGMYFLNMRTENSSNDKKIAIIH